MLPFVLTIVRHGETQCNKDGLLQGQSIDSPLSEAGERQARAAGSYLRDVGFTNVFVSDMIRAKQTAEIILKNNRKSSGLELVCESLLKERSFGIAEGQRVEDMRTMARAAGQSVPEFTPPDGETVEQVKLRFAAFLNRMFQRLMDDHRDKLQPFESAVNNCAEAPQTGRPDDGVQDLPVHTLVVSHGAYMRVVVRYLVDDLQCVLPQGIDMSHVFSACPNTGMCRFVVAVKKNNDSLIPATLRCIFINRKDHLRSEDE